MEEHVELALSRWAKEYNKEWERREKERKRMGFQDKSVEDPWQGVLEGRKSNAKT